MSETLFKQLLPKVQAIPEEAIYEPTMPVDTYIQEASDLEVWCKDEHALLKKAGIPDEILDTFRQRVDAAQWAQSTWLKERNIRAEAQRKWNEALPRIEEMKNQLEHTYRFAFRKRPDLLSKVSEIESGRTYADLIQDLSDLTALGKANKNLIKAVGMDVKILDESAKMANEMLIVLSEANGERNSSNVKKIDRDRFFTYLKEAVDEVRGAGKFLFWKNEEKLRGYLSEYVREKNAKRNLAEVY